MELLIGMDEAGYGPNLGPLVVAATAWEVPGGKSGSGTPLPSVGAVASAARPSNGATRTVARRPPATRSSFKPRSLPPEEGFEAQRADEFDLYRVLRNIVAKSASERRIAIADSKTLYHSGQGLRQLERGLHAVLLSMRQSLGCWSAVVKYCGADADGHHRTACWPDGFDCRLPIDAATDELSRLGTRLARACDAAGVRPLAIRARLVFPAQFNELVAHYHSKGAALSHVTVGLLRELMDAFCRPAETSLPGEPSIFGPQLPVYAVCDKHGGRNYYTALLQHHFHEHWIEPVSESHVESRYEWGHPESRIRVAFRMNGETFLPTALASMTAKYLRELAMRAFNDFWSAHVPNLRPTAGYSRDAWRFRNDIAATQRKLAIDDHVLWRSR